MYQNQIAGSHIQIVRQKDNTINRPFLSSQVHVIGKDDVGQGTASPRRLVPSLHRALQAGTIITFWEPSIHQVLDHLPQRIKLSASRVRVVFMRRGAPTQKGPGEFQSNVRPMQKGPGEF
jgi:hypothetical protein